jgi:hypothetical protein
MLKENRLAPLLLILLLTCFFNKTEAAVKLSDQARVSLITCGPGPDLYEAFGHTAIRVYDQKKGINLAYNYGIFSFNQPNFYLNFAKGHLWYRLGVNDFDRFVYSYEYNQRSVYEQVLNFDQAQKQALFDSLENNLKPENKYYLYDYFYHNCSTIPRDIIEYASGSSVDYKYSDKKFTKGKSIRDLVDEYLAANSWGDFGIDLALGSPIDGEATFHEYLYLPEYLMSAMNDASIRNSAGKKVAAINETIVHYQSEIDYLKNNKKPGPITVFWVFFALIALITFWNFKKQKAFKGLDFILFLLLGLNGSILAAIGLFTDHNSAAMNYNVLWNLPTHLIFCFFILAKNKGKLFNAYLVLTLVTALLVLTDDLILPQNIHPAVIPIVLAIMLRSLYMFWFDKNKLSK